MSLADAPYTTSTVVTPVARRSRSTRNTGPTRGPSAYPFAHVDVVIVRTSTHP